MTLLAHSLTLNREPYHETQTNRRVSLPLEGGVTIPTRKAILGGCSVVLILGLTELGLSTKGRKADLIARIKEHVEGSL